MKVIVVEDNPVYNDYVCNFLKKGGFDTMQAYRLSTAKKLLAKAEEDNTVLADLRLPDGEGVDLLRWMRKEGKPQPFIIMTDYAEVHTAVESMKLGSADYIPKQLVEDKLDFISSFGRKEILHILPLFCKPAITDKQSCCTYPHDRN